MTDPSKQNLINPFETADEMNPFSQGIQEYNPFQNQPQQPQVVQPVVSSTTPQFQPPSQPVAFNPPPQPDNTLTDVALEPEIQPGSPGTTRYVVTEEMDQERPQSRFYQPEYYRQFFNVDTSDVFFRLIRALFPFKRDFIDVVRKNPDFYGPLWITTSLIFMMAAAGNLASSLTSSNTQWHYDFRMLTYGSIILYGYSFLVPLLWWGLLRWMDIEITLMQLLCIYGYSLFIYFPIAIPCILPYEWLRWVLVGIACIISTVFLVLNLWIPLRAQLGKALFCLLGIVALHVGLALVFRLYFFSFDDPDLDITN
jgi:hypothetical protein